MVQNQEQIAFIEQPNVNGVLIGIPGGGKSTSIIERIIHQVDSGQIPREGGYLVVTFSKAAADDFRRKGVKRRPDVFDVTYIRTIHSLAGVIVSRDAKNSINTVVYRATNQIRENNLDAVGRFANVKVIYVDEAQDISRTQYELVCTMGEVLGAAVVLVGDADQALYSFQGGSAEFLRNHAGFRIELVRNYRSTNEIVALANAARPSKDAHPMVSASGASGPTPRIISNTHDVIARRIVEIAQESLKQGKLVAIIGPTKKSCSDSHGRMRNIGLQWAHHVLRKHGIKSMVHYNEAVREGSSFDKCKEVNFPHNAVHLFTIHGSKGLEFDTVILLNFHKELMGFYNMTAEDVDSYKCMVYVGFTRAKHDLWVFHRYGRGVWHEYADYSDKMHHEGEPIPHVELTLSPKMEPRVYQWLRLLTDRKLLPEDQLSRLEDLADINVATSGSSFKEAHVDLPDQEKLDVVYGQWAENLFENRYRGHRPKCYRRVKMMLDSMTIVPFEYRSVVLQIYGTLGLDPHDVLTMHDFDCFLEQVKIRDDVEEFIRGSILNNDGRVFFYVPTITRFFDSKVLHILLEECDKHVNIPSDMIWKLVLFLFQYDFECKYRWYFDYTKHIDALQKYESYIKQTSQSLPDGYIFDVECEMEIGNGKKIRGLADAVNIATKNLLELKFTTSFTMTQGLQALGYELMYNSNHDLSVKVMNLRTRKNYDISSNLHFDDYRKFFCNTISCS